MIKLSKKVEYGLISVLHIAAAKSNALTTCRDLADRYQIPVELLGKVLQALAKAKLIESVHGVKGGYRTIRPLKAISFGELIEALDGPVRITPCACAEYVCRQEPTCTIKEPVFHFQDQLMRFVFSIDLESFRNKELRREMTQSSNEIPAAVPASR